MEWVVNLAFLLIGYLLRLLGEQPKSKKEHKEVKIPTLNPMKIYKEHKAQREEEQHNKEIAIILENIDNYDGTSNGQKEVR